MYKILEKHPTSPHFKFGMSAIAYSLDTGRSPVTYFNVSIFSYLEKGSSFAAVAYEIVKRA